MFIDYYKQLGVTPWTSEDEIKKAYRKLSLEYHPNKNPLEGESFKLISKAYDVLGYQEQRYVYDYYGEEGIKQSTASIVTEEQKQEINEQRDMIRGLLGNADLLVPNGLKFDTGIMDKMYNPKFIIDNMSEKSV